MLGLTHLHTNFGVGEPQGAIVFVLEDGLNPRVLVVLGEATDSFLCIAHVLTDGCTKVVELCMFFIKEASAGPIELNLCGQWPIIKLSYGPVNIFTGLHVVVENLLLWESHIVDPIVSPREMKVFPVNDFSSPHNSIDFVVRAKLMIVNVLSLHHLSLVCDQHTVPTFGLWVIEKPITAGMVYGSNVTFCLICTCLAFD